MHIPNGCQDLRSLQTTVHHSLKVYTARIYEIHEYNINMYMNQRHCAMIPFGEHLDVENGKNSAMSEIFIIDYRHSFVSDQFMLQDSDKTYFYTIDEVTTLKGRGLIKINSICDTCGSRFLSL